jgi:hypothetical protein
VPHRHAGCGVAAHGQEMPAREQPQEPLPSRLPRARRCVPAPKQLEESWKPFGWQAPGETYGRALRAADLRRTLIGLLRIGCLAPPRFGRPWIGSGPAALHGARAGSTANRPMFCSSPVERGVEPSARTSGEGSPPATVGSESLPWTTSGESGRAVGPGRCDRNGTVRVDSIRKSFGAPGNLIN